MAIELATGYVSIVPSAKGFGSKLSSEIGGDLDNVGTDAGDRVSKGFMSKFSGTGVKIAATLGAAFASAKIADGLRGAVGNASDLNESMSKVGEIFGDASPIVVNFAAGADKSLGQSKQQALDAAANFAVFGKSAGLTGDQLAGFSTGLVGVSADFASFFNTSPEEAIQAIGSALVGESEPIRKYGVLLDESTIKNRALALGLISTTKDALTPQQKVLATQAEIMAQLGDSQGDFARTADGAANKQRILSAEAKNASAQFGQALLPAYTAFVTLMTERVLPALTKLITYLTEHKGVALAVGIVIASILVVAFLAWAAAAIAAAAATLVAIAPILLIAAAVVAFIAVFILLPFLIAKNFGKVLDIIGEVFGKIGEFFQALPGRILGFLTDAGTWLFNAGKSILQGLIDGIASLVPVVVEFFTSLPGRILGWVVDLAESLLHGNGQQVIQGILNGVESLIGAVANFFTSIPGWVLDWVRSLAASLLYGHGQQVIQGLLNGAAGFIGAVANFFASIPGWILGWIGNLGSLLFGVGASVIQGFINGMNSWMGSIAGTVSNIPNTVRNALGSLGGILFGAGQAIIEGLLNGIRSMAGAAASAARAVVQGAVNAAKSALGIGSPSRVFAEIGVNVGEGFVVGVQRTGGMVSGAVSDLLGFGPQRFSTAPSVSVSAAQSGGGVGGGSPTIVINGAVGDKPALIKFLHQGLREYETANSRTRGAY